MTATTHAAYTTLALHDLRFPVYLGWGDEERATTQTVRIDLDIHYASQPQACVSDTLEDTNCYQQLCDCIQSVCQQKSYRLIEHLCYAIYERIKKNIPNNALIKVCTHKLKPPIEALNRASFSCQDWPQHTP
jgi:FolB domain-containing protein